MREKAEVHALAVFFLSEPIHASSSSSLSPDQGGYPAESLFWGKACPPCKLQQCHETIVKKLMMNREISKPENRI